MKKKISLLELSKGETSAVKAGKLYVIPGCYVTPDCFCACWYDGYGGSTTSQNGSANHDRGLSSSLHNPRYAEQSS